MLVLLLPKQMYLLLGNFTMMEAIGADVEEGIVIHILCQKNSLTDIYCLFLCSRLYQDKPPRQTDSNWDHEVRTLAFFLCRVRIF